MTLEETMAELKSYGNQGIKNILLKHGVLEPFFGVKVEHLKIIQKKVKKDYQLALELFATNNADAMYLAGLIADDMKMTREDLQGWAKTALSHNISAYTVPWVTAGSNYGLELAMQWIDSNEEHIAVAGWSTLSGLVALKADEEIDMELIRNLMTRIEKNIHSSQNRVRQAMNLFIICIGTYIKELSAEAVATAARIGNVTVDMNGTACKVPNAVEYIKKVSDRGTIGKKRKVIKC